MEAEDNLNPWISELEPYVPGKSREGFVKLASNENNYGPSPRVVEALKGSVGQVYRYPYKDLQVKEAVAGYCSVNPENIVLGNGSDELIDLIVKTFRGPVLGVYPSFSEYGIVASTNGRMFSDVSLNPDFCFPVDEFLKQAESFNLLFLCSPNNPVGNTIPSEVLKQILDVGKVTVVDEAYIEFCSGSAIDLLSDYDNLIILRTFGKAFGLAGLRAGYAISNPAFIESISKTKPPFNVNLLAQEAVLACLKDLDYMRDCVEKMTADKARLSEALSVEFRVYPSSANFILADVSPRSSQDVFDFFIDNKIIIRRFGLFKGFQGDYVRVSVGTSEENNQFINALKEL